MLSQGTVLNCVLSTATRVAHDFLNPNGLEHNEITTRHTYPREDCDHNDPSLSPSSRSGKGAMTLTPAPNGAKTFNIAHRTRCIAKATESWSKEKKILLP